MSSIAEFTSDHHVCHLRLQRKIAGAFSRSTGRTGFRPAIGARLAEIVAIGATDDGAEDGVETDGTF